MTTLDQLVSLVLDEVIAYDIDVSEYDDFDFTVCSVMDDSYDELCLEDFTSAELVDLKFAAMDEVAEKIAAM